MLNKYLSWEEHVKTGKIYRFQIQYPSCLEPITITQLLSQKLQNLPIREVLI